MAVETLGQSVMRMLDAALSDSSPLFLTCPHAWNQHLPYLPTWDITTPHAHRYYEIAFVDHGECCIVIDGVPCLLVQGQFCILPPNATHYEVKVTSKSDYRLIWFCLKLPIVETFVTRYTSGSSVLRIERINDAYIAGPVTDLLEALTDAGHADDPFQPYVKRGYLLNFLGIVAPQIKHTVPNTGVPASAVEDPVISSAIAFMKTNLHDPDLGVRSMARHVAFSPNYFNDYFRDRVGTPPYHYLLRLRMDESRRLLADTDLPISTVATRVGFTSPGHFSRTFKQSFNESPQ